MEYQVGQLVICRLVGPLSTNTVAPPVEMDKEYKIQAIVLDKKGNQHLDVGLKSRYNYITSIETGEELPDGNKIHWCHPSRFEPAVDVLTNI
jgi:hypothetical protein